MPHVSPITTHVLDTAAGRPAAGVPVSISIKDGNAFREIGMGHTNADGRIADLLSPDVPLSPGIYKVRFETGVYFEIQKTKGF